MAQSDASSFIQRIKRDPDLASRIIAEPDLQSRLALAEAAGYPCTAADLESLAGMLHDADLDSIAGGLISEGCPCRGSSGKTGG